MAGAIYIVEIDFDKDGLYNHAQSDVTSYVQAMNWTNGMTQPRQEFANPAVLTLTLDNSAGDFNLEESSAAFFGLFKEGLLVRVRMIFSSSSATLFIGKLAMPNSLMMPTYGPNQFVIRAQDLMYALLDVEFTPTLQTDVTTDEALKQPFAQGVVALPYASSFWVLGQSTLGVDTVLLGESDMIDFDTGQTTLAYVGDIAASDSTQRAQQFLRDIVAAECGGRFFFNARSGKFTFHNRHFNTNPVPLATIDNDDYTDADYVPQTPVVNQVTMYYQPREVGAVGSVIYSMANPLRLATGETKTIVARYSDATLENARIGAMDFVQPQPGVDYVANGEEDGSGNNVTHLQIVSVDFGGTAATITITNTRRRRAWITKLQLRGTPLRSFNRQSVVTAPDGESVYNYDPHPQVRSIPAVDDEELAQHYADSLVARQREPHSELRSITILANQQDALMTQIMARDIGDVVTVTNADFDHARDYAIVGERHNVRAGGDHTHEVTWILEPVDVTNYWILGVAGFSELGETTILAF